MTQDRWLRFPQPQVLAWPLTHKCVTLQVSKYHLQVSWGFSIQKGIQQLQAGRLTLADFRVTWGRMTSQMWCCGVGSHVPLSAEGLLDKDETQKSPGHTVFLFFFSKGRKNQLSLSLCRSLEMREQRCPPLRYRLLGKGPEALGCLCQWSQRQLCVTSCNMTVSNSM